jgi:hypothetical protein
LCFSASVSFAAAALLLVEGIVALRVAPTLRHLGLAAVPILFAAQQACEGILWTEVTSAPFNKVTSGSAYAFLFFAFAIWPPYLPLVLALLERGRRRSALLAAAVLGLAAGGYLLLCVSFRVTDACIAQGTLYYWVQVDAPAKAFAPFAYLAVVVAPLLISSLQGTSLLALALAVAFAVSAVLGGAGFLSTWCFFAAMLSGLVTWMLLVERRSCRNSASASSSVTAGQESTT